MNGNIDVRDLDYYRRRERQEREHAAKSGDTTARRAHLEMAELYSSLLQQPLSDPSRARA